ncbi:hypothetical protein Cgig2_017425 [Carnegiea gigantea]|uniref:Uncharacterized protein n=1 Tax=Carnegiea gigantea TaxID=171969 RepID=A0A9Q1Q834_9CARY|nr:hypothetical protein Cgig2_017425 [Carnegiea gigantea]
MLKNIKSKPIKQRELSIFIRASGFASGLVLFVSGLLVHLFHLLLDRCLFHLHSCLLLGLRLASIWFLSSLLASGFHLRCFFASSSRLASACILSSLFNSQFVQISLEIITSLCLLKLTFFTGCYFTRFSVLYNSRNVFGHRTSGHGGGFLLGNRTHSLAYNVSELDQMLTVNIKALAGSVATLTNFLTSCAVTVTANQLDLHDLYTFFSPAVIEVCYKRQHYRISLSLYVNGDMKMNVQFTKCHGAIQGNLIPLIIVEVKERLQKLRRKVDVPALRNSLETWQAINVECIWSLDFVLCG